MEIKVYKLSDSSRIPTYGTEQSAGLDLYSCTDEDVIINPSDIVLISTKLIIEIPDGYYGAICSRSGLSLNHGIVVPNSPGIIDSDYRGELKVILHNISKKSFTITSGMRIAQMIIMKYSKATFAECGINDMTETIRGEGGFGSTSY